MEISEFIDVAGNLQNAKPYSFAEIPEQIAAIELQFENLSCSINILSETDEIVIQSPPNLVGVIESKSELIFHNCIGHRVRWCWTMINNQGYSDAIKFEFSHGITCELTAIASSIYQATVKAF